MYTDIICCAIISMKGCDVMTESRIKANNKYFEKFDDIKVRVIKGKKEEYKAFAEKQGVSLNGLIVELMERAMADKDFNIRLGEPIEDGVLKGFRVIDTKIR